MIHVPEVKKGPYIYLHSSMESMHPLRLIQGVAAYGREQTPLWNVRWGHYLSKSSVAELNQMDGILTFGLSPEQRQQLDSLTPPVVNLSSSNLPWDTVASVSPDDVGIGRMAALYFQERLYTQFAFLGVASHVYSRERLAGFQSGLGRTDFPVFTEEFNSVKSYSERLGDFLRALPHPTALFCANDYFARRACQAAMEMDLAVPDQLAILGVDADELISQSSPVPLSSVDPDACRMARRGAELLGQILRGEADRCHQELFPPATVRTERSTDALATEDPHLARALAFIRENAYSGINVDEVARVAGLGRRTLERRFKEALGHGIDPYIRRTRIHRAKSLLRDSPLSIAEISERCGFNTVYYFSTVFKKETGLTPGGYRHPVSK
ncbi:MAG: substrate-binding domain-containing protein [Verrucomicrobia bacterium]|nr:substrate-binding domain-containing protein [Verrucomicrobiota bacterium]MCH8526031.1 substrate-binding domain-containing protein [Kiritimatiellia bacterium]